jgi:demethylmenaquinone methyltransferase/2-methoxy-6-polyprenyl-1,4-benzoquinol methylase
VAGESPGTLEARQVRAMFDRIAGLYDAMNTLMTAGLHHRWRERAVALSGVGAGSRVIDVATGTGDLALALARAVGPEGEVLACDFSEEMLARARAKAPALCFDWADALALPYASDRFDAATVGFGARNFADLRRGIDEMVRVVRPGGRVVILEITRPTREPMASFFRTWFDRVVPALGRIAGDSAAYRYLPNSVKRFPGPRELAAVMEGCGLRSISYVLTAGGIIAIHVGEVP